MAAPTTGPEAVRADARLAVERLLRLLAAERGGLFVVLVYSLGIGLASLAAPLGVQMLVNAIAFGGLVQPIVVLTVLVLTALVFAGTLRAAQAWVAERIQQRLFVRVATDVAGRLPRAAARAFDGGFGPELVNRFFDVLTLEKGASMLLLDGILAVLQVLVGGTLLALYHPVLLAFAFGLLCAVGLILLGLGGGGTETSIAESKAKYALVAWLEELAAHPALFRGEGGRAYAETRSNALVGAYVEKRAKHFRIVFRQTLGFLALQAIATASLLAIGGWLVLEGKLTLGQLVAAELILTSVVATFAKLGKYLETYYDMVAAVDKLGTLADLEIERQGQGGLSADLAAARVDLRDVTYVFDDGRSALDGFSASFTAGERIAILGRHCSGKSTLVDLLYGMREPTAGRIEIDGLPLRDLALDTARQCIAVVREPGVIEGTVYENVTMHRPRVTLAEVKDALESVGIWDATTELPHGLDTPLTTTGANVSSGYAIRVAIARAIVGRPRLLMVDESLDALDPTAREKVLSTLLDPARPWTLLVTTRSPEIARAFSRVEELA